MNVIDGIQYRTLRDEFEFSRHATDRMLLRLISVQEVREVISTGEMIEDYPDDKYGPSCLIMGVTQENRILHIQCSYPSRPLIKIITAYEPDESEWADYRVRK